MTVIEHVNAISLDYLNGLITPREFFGKMTEQLAAEFERTPVESTETDNANTLARFIARDTEL